jgi:hypothetical protein
LLALSAVTGCALIAATPRAPATVPWMTEEALRAEIIGKTLDGHYGDGLAWTEAYLANGRLDYREKSRSAVGYWYFRGNVFCTFYDPPERPTMAGGCWDTIKSGANCYEFYLAGLFQPGDLNPSERGTRWNARGWRKDEPSTCFEKPTV